MKNTNNLKKIVRTISYLVKEFEMKKSAEGYKRQTTDKTGIIDALNYTNTKYQKTYLKDYHNT